MVYQELRIDRLNGLLIVPNRHRQIRFFIMSISDPVMRGSAAGAPQVSAGIAARHAQQPLGRPAVPRSPARMHRANDSIVPTRAVAEILAA